MKYAIIEQLRLQYPVKDLYEQMDLSESDYYSWRSQPLSHRQQDADRLNAPIKSFWGTMENELVYQQTYATRQQAIRDITEYIDIFHNRQRRQ